MTHGFEFKCRECGNKAFRALTGDIEDPSVEALECAGCGHVREV